MADYISEYTGLEIDLGVQKSTDSYVNVKSFGAVGDNSTDDTVAIQNAINSLPHFTHGATMIGATSGGGTVFFPQGKYLITDTLYFPGGVIFEGESLATMLYFDPATVKSMFEGDITKYSRNQGWTSVTFRNLTFLGRLLTSPYLENTAIDFFGVQRWHVDSCHFEGWGKAIQGGAVTYYHRINYTEFFNNLQCLNAPRSQDPVGSCTPIVITGGVMWNYEYDWDTGSSIVARPSELIWTETSVMAFGLSLEARNVVDDPATFACVRCIDNGGFTLTGGYCESSFPLVELDMTGRYKHTSVETTHNYAHTLFRFKNFLQANLSESATTGNNSSVSSSMANGKLTDLIPNPTFNNGLYGHISPTATTYITSEKFLNKKGVTQTICNNTTTNANWLKHTIPAEKLAYYAGQVLTFGMLVKTENCSYVDLKVQTNTPSLSYKYSISPFIEYDSDWKLYITTFNIIDGIGDINMEVRATAIDGAGGTSKVFCAGLYAWTDNPVLIPSYSDLDLPKIYSDASPSGSPSNGTTIDDDGDWIAGDKIYNDTPTAGGYEGWVCTVAGSPGTWKGFGAIEA